MVIHTIQISDNTKSQPSLKQKKVIKPYLEASEKVSTTNNVKPLPGQGHLIHDNPVSKVKYFFKDIAYDLKAVKDGYQGKANDHQSGRLNDVGLTIGGLGIASYLASQTTNPKAKLMEFVGLGAFLASMKIFPKIAINKPARIMHGFEIDKQYIDDQGRKKSVFQDSNYIPFDLYRGEYKSEDLDEIAVRMGIPEDTINKHEIVKEQMRKIATQNNTLWMLTAGLATPAMAGLACCVLEQPISSGIVQYRNAKYNEQIKNVLESTKNMKSEINTLKDNSLSIEVSKILTKYKTDGYLPQEEFKNISKLIGENLDVNTKDNLIKEIKNVLENANGNSDKIAVLDNESIKELIEDSRKGINARKNKIAKVMPTVEEFRVAISEVTGKTNNIQEIKINHSDIPNLRNALSKIIDSKIELADDASKDFLKTLKTDYLSNLSTNIRSKKTLVINDEVIKKINNLAIIIGDYKSNQSIIDACKNFKFAHAPETVIANYSGKFERALLNELNFTQDELKKIRDSADYAKNILDKRLSEIANDDIQYNRIVKKLTKIISDMETTLHGGAEKDSVIRELVVAIENNANNTAKRLDNLKGFEETILSLVNDNISELDNKFDTENSFRDLLEGTIKNTRNGNYRKEISGVGSYKHLQIANLAERYQGTTNSFLRVLEALDVYKRALNPAEYAPEMAHRAQGDKYVERLIEVGKRTIIDANCAEHMTKLNTVNNGEYYRDIIKSLFRIEYKPNSEFATGILTQATENAVGDNANLKSILEKLKRYIGRFYEIVPNNTNDTLKDKTHTIDVSLLNKYDKACRTNKSIFDLVAQEPTEMLRGAAGRRYGTRKWAGIIGSITAGVFAITYLTQLSFGKLNRPQKQNNEVNNDANK